MCTSLLSLLDSQGRTVVVAPRSPALLGEWSAQQRSRRGLPPLSRRIRPPRIRSAGSEELQELSLPVLPPNDELVRPERTTLSGLRLQHLHLAHPPLPGHLSDRSGRR